MTFKSILDKIQKELVKKDKIREQVQADMRKATRLSKQAILFVHQDRFDYAKRLLGEATCLFSGLEKISRRHPDLVYSGIVDAAFQEYTEARMFFALVENNEFVDPEDIGVPVVSFVLGATDVIGELRRRALDSIRNDKIGLAEKCLQLMENIYGELMAMDDAYLLVSGLRRKCDIARNLIEITRGEVTIEVRRKSLEDSIEKLKKTIVGKTKIEKKR